MPHDELESDSLQILAAARPPRPFRSRPKPIVVRAVPGSLGRNCPGMGARRQGTGQDGLPIHGRDSPQPGAVAAKSSSVHDREGGDGMIVRMHSAFWTAIHFPAGLN